MTYEIEIEGQKLSVEGVEVDLEDQSIDWEKIMYEGVNVNELLHPHFPEIEAQIVAQVEKEQKMTYDHA